MNVSRRGYGSHLPWCIVNDDRWLECVPNVSEGRDRAVIDRLASAAGATLLDVHVDPDHHRSVYTLAHDRPRVEHGIRRMAEEALEHLDVTAHRGVHPRLGALDVVPFVALHPGRREEAIDAARAFAGWLGGTLEVPVFLYGGVDTAGRGLPEIRAAAFERIRPDHGPAAPHPTFGAAVVGERPLLVAVNCLLDTDDLEMAQAIATRVRERDGGLPGIRALGFRLESRRCAQVSMNVTDLTRTGVEEACTTVRARAEALGAIVTEIELVGLVPESEYESWSDEFREWSGVGADRTIEARLRHRTS